MRRIAKKAGLKLTNRSGTKLKDILGSPNKTKIDPQHKKGVYCHQCPCDPKAKYVGMTTRKFTTRSKEHKKAFETQKWTHSGIVAHKQVCDQPIDWENPKILDTMTGKNKTALYFDIRLRESLWIAKENSGPGHGLNEDWGGAPKDADMASSFRENVVFMCRGGGGLLPFFFTSPFS